MQTPSETFTLTSPTFEHNGIIPLRYTCDGDRTLNPSLHISGVPDTAKCLVLIMDDPDVPKAVRPDGIFDHWVLFNIPPTTTRIEEHMSVGTLGANGRAETAYTGPCPPPEHEPAEHRYFFKLYALDTMLSLTVGATKAAVMEAMDGHLLAQTELIGRYQRPRK